MAHLAVPLVAENGTPPAARPQHRSAGAGGGVARPPSLAPASTSRPADVVLMRSDPLEVATAISISRGTVRRVCIRTSARLGVGYNSLALPIAAGVFEPLGFVLRPELGAISMARSSSSSCSTR